MWNLFRKYLTYCCCLTPLFGFANDHFDFNETRHEIPENFVQNNNTFAFNLYSQIKGQKGNLLFSPYSISYVLAMTNAGAVGSTEAGIEKALNFKLKGLALHEAFAKLDRYLTHRTSHFDNDFRLTSANSLWLQTGQEFLPDFMHIMINQYKAGVHQVDFMTHSNAARLSINHWVKEHTEGKIENLLHPEDLDSFTRLVLISTLHLKMKWLHPFNAHQTNHAPFFINEEKTTSVPMMEEIGFYPLLQRKDFMVLELPYLPPQSENSPEFSMLVLLPNERTGLSTLENHLSSEKIQKWISELHSEQVHLFLPKFKISENIALNNFLKNMGMAEAFSDKADFSKISGSKDLAINKVIHEAFMSTDENGTEAAAATAVSIGLKSFFNPDKPIEFRADHPFCFLIIEKSTKTILFLGRVVNP